jgi:hypothetical protein
MSTNLSRVTDMLIEANMRASKLEKERDGLKELIDNILNTIPETYVTGHGWGDDLETISGGK